MAGRAPETKRLKLAVEPLLARLEQILRERPERFAAVGGDVALHIKGAQPPAWHVASVGAQVIIRPGNAPFPVCTIGLSLRPLRWLVQGTLDVPAAFKERYLIVEGDRQALARFVNCFETAKPLDNAKPHGG